VDECKPLVGGGVWCDPRRVRELRGGAVGRGLHSFPFPLKLSFLCAFPLNLSLLRVCPPCNPNQPVDVSARSLS